MPITHPMVMPRLRIARPTPFELMRMDAVTGTAQRTIVVSLSDPRWRIDVTTGPLGAADFATWRQFLDAQENGQRSFHGYDPWRVFPAAYPRGQGAPPAWPTGVPWSASLAGAHPQNPSGRVSLQQLPVGYRLSVGDYLSWTSGSASVLHRVLEDATATASGLATVDVTPRVSIPSVAGQAVLLYQASCRMRLVPGSWRGPNGAGFETVSFSALQEIG